MSKIIYVIILGGMVLVAIAAINVNTVNARQEAEFIQISVLADEQANYGVDENLFAIPAISMEIVEDTVHDLQRQSLVPVIRYTSLPAKDSKVDTEDSDVSETVDQIKHDNNNEGQKDKDNNGNGNGNNGNGGGNNNNGGQKDKNNNGNGGQKDNKGNDGNGGGKTNEKESKPEKTQ